MSTLYNLLMSTFPTQELGLSSPEDLFDIETFLDDPTPFYRFAKTLYPGKVIPSASHRFLAWLNQRQMLLRVYTQNIDGLEEQAGVMESRVVYAHGSLLGATCVNCRATYRADEISDDVQTGKVPLCKMQTNKKKKILTTSCSATPESSSTNDASVGSTRSLRQRTVKQCSEGDAFEACRKAGLCGGVIKPNITFFGEKLGNDVGRSLQKDYESADALIVMGTSLSV